MNLALTGRRVVRRGWPRRILRNAPRVGGVLPMPIGRRGSSWLVDPCSRLSRVVAVAGFLGFPALLVAVDGSGLENNPLTSQPAPSNLAMLLLALAVLLFFRRFSRTN